MTVWVPNSILYHSRFEVQVLEGVRDKLLSLSHGSGHMAIDIQ